MIDVFLFCDLAGMRISARGEAAGDEVLALVRVIDLLPTDCTAIVDLSDVLFFDEAAESMLRGAIEARAADGILFRVIRGEPAGSSALDAA